MKTLQDALDAATRMRIDPRDIYLTPFGSVFAREKYWDGGICYTVVMLKEAKPK